MDVGLERRTGEEELALALAGRGFLFTADDGLVIGLLVAAGCACEEEVAAVAVEEAGGGRGSSSL